MNSCNYCDNLLEVEHKFCSKCGKPRLNIDKLKKRIRTTGRSFMILGIFSLLYVTASYIGYFKSVDINLPSFLIISYFVLVIIILSKRIMDLKDKHTKDYLYIILMCVFIMINNLLLEIENQLSWVHAIRLMFYIILAVYLIMSIKSVNKLSETKEFIGSLATPKYFLHGWRWIILTIVVLVVAALVEEAMPL